MTASPLAGQPADVPPVASPDGTPVADGEVPPVPVAEEPEEKKRRRRKAFILLFLLGLLALLIGLIIWYLLFRQPLPIIPPVPDAQLPGYSWSIYGSDSPTGVAVTPEGDRIYVTETRGDRVVRIFDGAGNEIGIAAPPAETGSAHTPVYVAIDPMTEEVYVTDRPTGSIYIYDRDGRYQRTFSAAEPLTGWQPLGIAFDKAGLLYVTDLGGTAMVKVFDRTGAVVRTLGATDALNFPNGVAVDDNGIVYVTDSSNGRLLAYGSDGSIIARIGRGNQTGNLGLPRGVAIDGQGRVFVVDTTGQSAALYRALRTDERRLEYVGTFGGPGIANGQFTYPMGVAVDARGRIYVADTGNDRIQVWGY